MAFDSAILDEPLTRFLVQIMMILGMARLVGALFRRIGQPAVAAEMITGILLGPSVLGNIPGWMDVLFTTDRLQSVQMLAYLALIFYMFIVGLELDIMGLVRAGPKALGLVICAGAFGCLCAVPLAFIINDGTFFHTTISIFVLYFGVVMAIADTPVIVRLLSERYLIATAYGVLVMAFVIADDILAWPILAILTSLANNTTGSPIDALYTIPILVGDVLVLWYAIRPALLFATQHVRGDSIPPWFFFTTMFLLVAFCSATQAAGLTVVLGALEIGMVMPRDNPRLVHRLVTSLQDLTVVLLLPLFFATSGLKVNFWLLNTLRDWGLVLFVYVLAIATMLIGAGLPILGLRTMPPQQAASVGVLLSAKGVSGIIALNLGLDSGIITPKFYSLAVVMVLATTCGVVPLAGRFLPQGQRPDVTPLDVNELAGGKRVVVCLEELDEGLDLVSVVQYMCRPADALLGIRFLTTHERLSDFLGHHPDNTVADVCADRARLLGLHMRTTTLMDSDPTVDDVEVVLQHGPALVLLSMHPFREEALVAGLIEGNNSVIVAGFIGRDLPATVSPCVVLGINGDAVMTQVARWIFETRHQIVFVPMNSSTAAAEQLREVHAEGLGAVTEVPEDAPTGTPLTTLYRLADNCAMVVIPATPDDASPGSRQAATDMVLSNCNTSVMLIFHSQQQIAVRLSTGTAVVVEPPPERMLQELDDPAQDMSSPLRYRPRSRAT